MYFLQGLTMGLAYVAPIGMQNLFVINSAMTQPLARLYLTALIVVFFDISLAVACFFGIGAVMEHSEWLRLTVLGIGSLLVIRIGLGLLRSTPPADTHVQVDVPLRQVITSAFVVTWLNPQALIDGSLMLGAFRATLPAAQSSAFILGVATASALWFFGISTAISLARTRVSPQLLRGINLACGVVIVFYGCRLLWEFVRAAFF